MAHVQKYTRGAAGVLLAHYDRTKEVKELQHPEKTRLNENLADKEQPLEQHAFLRQRLGEVKTLTRKDVNVMVDWVVTMPKGLASGDEGKFFKETYEFLRGRYGAENVISAYVHRDEVTPHMHYAFIPVVEDRKHGGYKLSAKEAVNREDLRKFHGELSRRLEKAFGRDVGVLNEATKEGNKSIDELKRGTARETLARVVSETERLTAEIKNLNGNIKLLEYRGEELKARISDLNAIYTEKEQGLIKSYENHKNALNRKIEGLEREINAGLAKVNEIKQIQPRQTITGAVKGVTVGQVKQLQDMAIGYIRTARTAESLTAECSRLTRRCENLEKLIPSRAEQAKAKQEREAFRRLPGDIKARALAAVQTPSRGAGGHDMGR